MTALAPSLQAYFVDRLVGQRRASPNTIAAYRHAYRLLLGFASTQTSKPPSALDVADLDAPLIASFLDHLEQERHNTVATRNNRLAAVHSLFAYLALHHPEHADTIARVLAIPAKRTDRNLLTYLTDPEVEALLAACDQTIAQVVFKTAAVFECHRGGEARERQRQHDERRDRHAQAQ